jgi:choline dehydrogenase-like flavoprotein
VGHAAKEVDAMSAEDRYDAIVVGAGVNGALMAKRLTRAHLRVLVLEAGPDTAVSFDGYTRHLEHFYAANAKGPESPWPPAAAAPQPDTVDIHASGGGYFVQRGPQKYASGYTRAEGGSTLHWLGVSLRMLPEDFEMRSRHGVGRDWPLGYADLEPYYRQAEYEMGVAADVADQAHLGVEFAEGYDYPMSRIPPSYLDQTLAAAVDGMEVALDGEKFALKIRNYPAARNSMPRGDFNPVGAVDERRQGQALGRDIGQRCQGNTACTPICPVQAKYNANKTLAEADRDKLAILPQAVASRINVDSDTGEVQSIEYQRYEDSDCPRHTVHTATARIYVLAAHAVENAKLMLASGLGGQSGMLGRNLMDHPALYHWGLAPINVGAWRGPLSTAGLDDLRGGSFRAKQAAFRFDIGNDGWRSTTGAPDSTVADAVIKQNLVGSRLREHLADILPRQVRFSLAVEQLPSPDNRVTIDPRYLDVLGNPRPVIDYQIDQYTLGGMAAATDVARKVFEQAGVEDCTDPDMGTSFPSVSDGENIYHYHGMGHFAGTHLMGDSPDGSVIDADQRSWEHRNLYLLGSGSFPTMGTSNPTLTMAALTLRTADHLEKELGG